MLYPADSAAGQPIYQFYAELKDYEPKLWRRFQVLENTTMARLGYTPMAMYEMKANHLFRLTVPSFENIEQDKTLSGSGIVSPGESWQFEVDNKELFPGEGGKVSDAAAHKLRSVLQGRQGEKLTLEYDYGNGWEVEVTLETILEDKELSGRELPRVLAGEGYGIIEDCGRPGGLEQLAEAFRRKSGNEYERYRKWLDRDELDLTAFDLDDMNLRLKRVPRIMSTAELRPGDPSISWKESISNNII